jgi:hypothetical protein
LIDLFMDDVLPDFYTGTYQVIRREAPLLDDGGRLLAPDESTFTIQGHAQEPMGDDLLRIPEGMRDVAHQTLYTQTFLRIVPMPDIVVFDDGQYEMVTQINWSQIGNYYHFLMRRIPD